MLIYSMNVIFRYCALKMRLQNTLKHPKQYMIGFQRTTGMQEQQGYVDFCMTKYNTIFLAAF